MTTWANGRQTPDPVSEEHQALGGYDGHNGIDLINTDEGLNWSVLSGEVILAAYNGLGGNEVRIRHDCGHGCITRELHGATGAFRVGVGQRVGERAPLIATGTTGQSTGVHVHQEHWFGGDSNNRMEPRQWMALHGLTPAGIDTTPITQGESDMKTIRAGAGSGSIAQVGEFGYYPEGGNWPFTYPLHQKINGGVVDGLTDDEYATAMNEAQARRAGLVAEVATAVVKALGSAGIGGWKPTAADLAKLGDDIAANVEVTPIDPAALTKPIVDAIKAGDAAILTAIAGVDEATLATFGLKRT